MSNITRRLVAVLFTIPILMGQLGFAQSQSKPDIARAEEQQHAAKIMVYKADRTMELLDQNSKVLKTYKISLGNPIGHKTQEGDRKTPEGLYKISGRNPKSRYHLSLRVSYPNAQDKAQAAQRGISPGGDIMVHGLPNKLGRLARVVGYKISLSDTWTDGCIAVTDKEIEEIWKLVPNDTIIEIKP